MDSEFRATAEKILGYTFQDPSLLDEALTHASVAGTRQASNERMEFLGDAILGMVVCEHLFVTFPDLLEGDLTKIKSAAVSRRACAKIAQDIQIDQLLRLGKGMQTRNGMPSSVSAAVFESVIAAIHIDGGLDSARTFILEHMIPVIDQAFRNGHQYNFKSILQQFSQQQFERPATYVLIDENGPDHAKCFKVTVEIGETQYPASWASSKKQAEQRAALNALLEMGAASIDPHTDEIHLIDEVISGLVGDERNNTPDAVVTVKSEE